MAATVVERAGTCNGILASYRPGMAREGRPKKKVRKQHDLRAATLVRLADRCVNRANELACPDPGPDPKEDAVGAAAGRTLAELGAIFKEEAKATRRLR
jgi:hypothetical protein